jgi:hypothetical protein
MSETSARARRSARAFGSFEPSGTVAPPGCGRVLSATAAAGVAAAAADACRLKIIHKGIPDGRLG